MGPGNVIRFVIQRQFGLVLVYRWFSGQLLDGEMGTGDIRMSFFEAVQPRCDPIIGVVRNLEMIQMEFEIDGHRCMPF